MDDTRSDTPRHDRGDTWVLDLAVAAEVAVPDGCGAGRAAFVEWLWGTLGEYGLAGVFEGSVDAGFELAMHHPFDTEVVGGGVRLQAHG